MSHTNALGSPPTLVAVPVRTTAGLLHVTGQTIDEAGLVAIHPELSEAGFTGRWQITNVLTGQSISVLAESSAWVDRRVLTAHEGGGS